MIKKQDIPENFSNEYLETLIKNVIENNSQDNQDFFTSELSRSYLYTLVSVDETATQNVTMLRTLEDTQTFLPVFTNEEEMASAKSKYDFQTVLINFVEICDLILYQSSDYKGIMINPDNDRIIVDKQLLEYIVELHRQSDHVVTLPEGQSVEVISIDKQDEPKNIINVLNELFKKEKDVNAAYLKLLNHNGNMSYLLVTDFEGDKDSIFKKISDKVKPHLKDIYLDQLEYNTEFGKEVTKDIKPFYRKKAFGIF
jgi:hypothetical protein